MKLFEEFKLYEHLWESTTEEIPALWVNPDGIEINLADPIAFDNELAAEKARYQHELRKRFSGEDQNILSAIKRHMRVHNKTMAEVLDDWITDHVKDYERKLSSTLEMLHVKNNNLQAIAQEPVNTVIRLYSHYYDISKEKELIDYIDAKMRIKGRLGKQALLDRAKAEQDYVIRILVKSGHSELVDVAKSKFEPYIKQFEWVLSEE
jgi:hypothetical protein